MAESFPDQVLREVIHAHFDCCCGDLRFRKSATGKFNTTYFVGGLWRPLVLRIAPPDDAGFVFYEKGMMAQEPGIHRIILEHTTVPVAEILRYDTSRHHIDRDYLVMQRLPGTSLAEFHPSHRQFDKVLEQVGGYLREIHHITAGRYGYLGEHRCMEPQETWAAAFAVMWESLTDDVARAGYYDADEKRWVNVLLQRQLSAFDRPVASCLLHMDIWSQNILVDDEARVTGLVDFDRALWGDREIEFAVLDYCGISEPSFWKGYGESRDESSAARTRQVFYLAYEIQKYIVIRHYRHNDSAGARAYKDQTLRTLSHV